MLKNSYLLKSDFEGIGEIANHCDYTKLDVAINEAVKFDLHPLLCDLFWLVKPYFNSAFNESFNEDFTSTENSEKMIKFLNGGSYKSCNGIKKEFEGVKKVLAYYAYARYVIVNAYNDTGTGLKRKENLDSLPLSQKELEQISDRYRSMGFETWERLQEYLCSEKRFFKYSSKECKDCGCRGSDCRGTKAKGYGARVKIISKL